MVVAVMNCASLVTDRLYLRTKDMTDSACKSILASEVDWREEIALVFVAHIVGAAEGSCRGTWVGMSTKHRS